MTTTFDGSGQDAHPRAPVTWVLAMDPRFQDFSRRRKAERGTEAFAMHSKWISGARPGFFFPAHWVDPTYRTTGA